MFEIYSTQNVLQDCEKCGRYDVLCAYRHFGHHLHFLLWCWCCHLLLLQQHPLMTPANTTSSTCAPSPSTPNMSHTTTRGKHGWCLRPLHILVDLCLLLNADASLHILLWLLLLRNMPNYCMMYHRLGLHSIAIHNSCNCIALWGV
jgi:hypothetical protein